MTADLMTRARAGDGAAFRELTEPYRRELQVHCYRMLGSLQDAEDALQDTLLAAWQGLEAFEGRASIRSWLYRIATHRCLNVRRAVARRRAREWTMPGVEPPEPTRLGEVLWLEPYPDALLEGAIDVPLGPEARYEQTESLSLAFLTALQALPRRQLAVLVLRDVLGMPATEVAGLLGATVDSVHSALKRARAGLRRRQPQPGEREPAPPRAHRPSRRSWRSSCALTRPGIRTRWSRCSPTTSLVSMPPIPLEYQGREAAAHLFASIFRSGRRVDLVPTRANAQPAFGAYLRASSGGRHGSGLFVLTLTGDRIGAFTRFDSSVFPWFGLPRSLSGR